MGVLVRWVRYWGGAVLVGISVAVCAGFVETFPPHATSVAERHNYLGHHLYATLVGLLGANIDRWLLPSIGLVLLGAVLIHVGRLGHGHVRRFLRFGLPLLALIALTVLYLRSHPDVWVKTLTIGKSTLAVGRQLVFSPLGLLLPLALFGWLEWRIIRARRRPATAPAPTAQARRRRPIRVPVVFLWGVLRRIAAASVTLLLLALAALSLARLYYRWQTPRALQDQPNIIFIMVDTLRADHVGCYGYDLPTTPNIDRFAREATRFEQAIAPSSWTVWSVNSIMTSQYPDVIFSSHQAALKKKGADLRQPMMSGMAGAPLRYTTLAEVLQDRGYATNAVVSNPWLQKEQGNAQGYAWYDDSASRLNTTCDNTSPRVNEVAIKRLAELEDRPFFMYLVYMDPHGPYLQHDGFRFQDSSQDRHIEAALPKTVTGLQRAERRDALRRYNSEIAYTDAAVGRFLDELKRRKLYDDALIVFFSDHGEEFREHGGTDHMKTVYQEVISVPLIIKFPRQRAARTVPGRFQLLDLYPSVLATLQYDGAPFGLQGNAVKLPGLLRSMNQPVFSATTTTMRCVLDGERKYLNREEPRMEECYDLAADPLEQHNLGPAAGKDLREKFAAWDERNQLLEARNAVAGQQGITTSLSQRLVKQLQAIGYLHGDDTK
ncbi:MAG: sulfatase [Armatimonadota bacterium]